MKPDQGKKAPIAAATRRDKVQAPKRSYNWKKILTVIAVMAILVSGCTGLVFYKMMTGLRESYAFEEELRQQEIADLKTTIANLSQSLANDPKNTDLLFARGSAFERLASLLPGSQQDNFSLARDDFELGLSIQPKDFQARRKYADCLLFSGQEKEALTQLEIALKHAQEDPSCDKDFIENLEHEIEWRRENEREAAKNKDDGRK